MLRSFSSKVRSTPGYAAGVIGILAAGFIVSTAALSLVSAFLLRPLPVEGLDRLVRLREVRYAADGSPAAVSSLSPTTWRLWRERSAVFEDIAAATADGRNLSALELPQRIPGARVTPNFFRVLGLDAYLGRTFAPEETPADATVVISYGLWRRMFGGDPEALGRSLELDGDLLRVVGILPRGVSHPYSAEFWTPLEFGEEAFRPSGNYLYAPARLADGVTPAEAEESMRSLAARLQEEVGNVTSAEGAAVRPLRDELLRDLAPVLALISGAAFLVLLLSLVNVVNLMLARSVREARQAAVRLALGASLRRLFTESLARNLVLVGAAAVAAAIAAQWLLPHLYGIAGLSPINEFDAEPRLDLRTLGLVVALGASVAALLAALEAFRRTRPSASQALGSAGHRATGSRELRRAMRGIAVLQLAVSFALIGGAAAVLADFRQLLEGDPGFALEGRVLADVALPSARYPDTASRVGAISELERRLAEVPGVRSVGSSTVTPDYAGSWGASFLVPGREAPDPPGTFATNHRLVTGGYFATIGIPVVAGRTFNTAELGDPETHSVILSRSFARDFFATPADALGQEVLRVGARGEVIRRLMVIGVVGDVDEASVSEFWNVEPTWYLPVSVGTEYDLEGATLVVDVEHAGLGLFDDLRRAVVQVDPGLAAGRLAWLRDRLIEAYSRNELSAVLYSLFGVVALVVAASGLFSLQSFLTSSRVREFGIRSALGATPGRLLRLVVREVAALCAASLAVGAPLLWAAHDVYRGFVAGAGSLEPRLVTVSALVLSATALLATLTPALRVFRLDPREALLVE